MTRLALRKLLPLALLLVILLAGVATLARNGRAAELPSVAGIVALGSGIPGTAAVPPSTMAATNIEPGNYCVSCHSAGDPRLQGDLTAWRGGIEAAAITPCPAVKKIQEELFYTERLLLAIDRYQAALPAYADTRALDSRLAAGQQGYLRLLDTPVTSLDAFTAEAQSVRFTLGKVYAGLQAADEAAKRTLALTVGFGVSLILLGSLAWGLHNTTHVKAQAGKPTTAGLLKTTLFVLLVMAFFSLPFLRLPPQVDAASTAEALEVQTELDTVQRAGDAANRAYARAWMLGRIAARWQPLDPAQGNVALELALQAAEEANTEAAALWGEASAAQEAAVIEPTKLESAGLIAGEVQAARNRAWYYRRMSEDWYINGADWSDVLLDKALAALPADASVYSDLDRRSSAVTSWAGLDGERAQTALKQIHDPAVRSWGYREVAGMSGLPEMYRQAIEAARLISYPVQNALALANIAARHQEPGWEQEIAETLAPVEPVQRAFALAQAAALTGSDKLAASIEPGHPPARTLAYLYLNRFESAWEYSQQITDPFERARAQSEIVTNWIEWDPSQAAKAGEIAIPLLRDRTVRNVIQFTGDASLVEQIVNPYDRVLALTSIGRYDEAEALAGELKDTRPLVELALAVVRDDPQRALALVEKLTREADKTVVLTAVAAQTGDAEIFERALAMAAAARVRGDALAPVQATLNLVWKNPNPALAEQALQQALDLAERISIK